MLRQSNFPYYLRPGFCGLHTEATSSGLRENVKLHKSIGVLTKDGATEMEGVGVYGYKGCVGRCKVGWGCREGTPMWNNYQDDVCVPTMVGG